MEIPCGSSTLSRISLMLSDQSSAPLRGGVSPPRSRSFRKAVRSALKLVEVRLRIPIVLLISAVVVGRWDVIRNYWDRMTHVALRQKRRRHAPSPAIPSISVQWIRESSRTGQASAGSATWISSAGSEEKPRRYPKESWPACRSLLTAFSLRESGRLNCAIEPLARSYFTAGIVRRDGQTLSVPVEFPRHHASWLRDCKDVTVQCKDVTLAPPSAGRLRFHAQTPEENLDISATVSISDPASELEPGMIVDVTCRVPIARLEPFRSLPTDPPPLKPGEPRSLYACPEHADLAGIQPGRCSIEGNELEARPLAENQRIQWWCPMHSAVTSDRPGEHCQECGGMILKPRVVSYQPPGKVLAVPESAVIDSGLRTVVFVETMPGMFDGIEVVLGPRCGDSYPVIKGLEAGQKVAVIGSLPARRRNAPEPQPRLQLLRGGVQSPVTFAFPLGTGRRYRRPLAPGEAGARRSAPRWTAEDLSRDRKSPGIDGNPAAPGCLGQGRLCLLRGVRGRTSGRPYKVPC